MIYTEAYSIRDIDETRWDTVTHGNLSMTHRFLRLMEASWHSYTPYYLLFENDQGPLAVAVVNRYEAFKNQGLIKWLYQHFNLVFRCPYTTECGVMTRPDVSLESVIPELVQAMERLCRRERRLFMTVSNISNPNDLPIWQKAGFLATTHSGVNVLDLPDTYELYLKTLRSKDRSELRRIHKRADELNIRFEIDFSMTDREKAYQLFSKVFARHGVSQDVIPFTSQLLAEAEREMPGQMFLIKGFVQNALAGVFLCFLDGPTLWWQTAGLDYEIARPSYLYFLLMDEMVKWAIQHGVRRIFGGLTNDQEKQRHGFHLDERWFCYRASIQPLNWVLIMALPFAQRLVKKHMKTL